MQGTKSPKFNDKVLCLFFINIIQNLDCKYGKDTLFEGIHRNICISRKYLPVRGGRNVYFPLSNEASNTMKKDNNGNMESINYTNTSLKLQHNRSG